MRLYVIYRGKDLRVRGICCSMHGSNAVAFNGQRHKRFPFRSTIGFGRYAYA